MCFDVEPNQGQKVVLFEKKNKKNNTNQKQSKVQLFDLEIQPGITFFF